MSRPSDEIGDAVEGSPERGRGGVHHIGLGAIDPQLDAELEHPLTVLRA